MAASEAKAAPNSKAAPDPSQVKPAAPDSQFVQNIEY